MHWSQLREFLPGFSLSSRHEAQWFFQVAGYLTKPTKAPPQEYDVVCAIQKAMERLQNHFQTRTEDARTQGWLMNPVYPGLCPIPWNPPLRYRTGASSAAPFGAPLALLKRAGSTQAIVEPVFLVRDS